MIRERGKKNEICCSSVYLCMHAGSYFIIKDIHHCKMIDLEIEFCYRHGSAIRSFFIKAFKYIDLTSPK